MENEKIVLNEVSPLKGFWEVTVEVLKTVEGTDKEKKVKEVSLVDAYDLSEIEKKVTADYGPIYAESDYKIVNVKKSKIGLVY